MDDWRSAFAEEWDVVVMGTGMKECLLSGLLSVAGKKVLHLDRNGYYGGASASLDIRQLFEKFAGDAKPEEAALGKLRDYAIDLVPKFIMAGGNLVKVLIHTGVANYMEFKPVDGSFVFSKKAGKVCRVPATPKDCMKSSLMGMGQKTLMVQLVAFVQKVDLVDKDTWKSGLLKRKVALDTMDGASFFKWSEVDLHTTEFLIHSVCLYRDDSWKSQPALQVIAKMKLYLDSMLRFEGMTSPYLYPLYGLGELPQAFARLAAVHGGTYMLNRDLEGTKVFGPDDLTVEYGPEGVACGVRVKDVVARTKCVIGDPSYFPGLCENKGKVVRAIAILDQPVQGSGEPPAQSHQIIFPNTSIGRANDVYLFCTSSSHKCSPQGKFLAFVSTNVEGATDGLSVEAVGQRELAAGLQLLGRPTAIFFDMYDLMVPKSGGTDSKVFISESFDPTTHFETAVTDVMAMYKRITGAELQLTDGPKQ